MLIFYSIMNTKNIYSKVDTTRESHIADCLASKDVARMKQVPV